MAGNNKRIINKKESKYERQLVYNKRSKGLLKKAFEISELCDTDIALIMYSPNNILRHFSGNKRLERILQDYIQQLATNPEKEGGRPVISQDTIDKINTYAGQSDMVNQQGLEAPEREEIDEEIIRQYKNKLLLLRELARKLNPNLGISNSSIQESLERKRYLEEVLYKIRERKTKLLSGFNIRSPTDISSPPNTQGQQVPQADQVLIGYPSSSSSVPPQAGTETVMWVPPEGGEKIQVPLNAGEQTANGFSCGEQLAFEQPSFATWSQSGETVLSDEEIEYLMAILQSSEYKD